mgnify:CR=1 FL=1
MLEELITFNSLTDSHWEEDFDTYIADLMTFNSLTDSHSKSSLVFAKSGSLSIP